MSAVATSSLRRGCAFGLAATLLGPGLGACGSPTEDPPGGTLSAGVSSPAPTEAGSSSDEVRAAYEAEAGDAAAIREMLDRRARAVRDRDEAAFLATVDDRDPRTLAQQRTLFANLGRLRLSRFDYETTADQLRPDPVRGTTPGDPVVRLRTVEHVQVAGALTGPVGNEVQMTYVRRDGVWLVGRETAPTYATGDVTQLRPWFGVPVDVADRGQLVVLTDAADPGLADRLARIVEQAVAADAALLRVEADRRVLVDATSNGPRVRLNDVDEQEAAAIYTGVFDVDAQGRSTTPAGGTIRVNPDLTAAEVVADPGLLRHEVVHLLLREYAGSLPMWLSEGVAEYARWYPLTTADLQITPELALRIDRAPRDLPEAGVFQLDPPVNYLVAQAAAQHLFALGGAARLRTLHDRYRAVGEPVFEGQTANALGEVYGISEDELVAAAWVNLGELDR